MPEPTSPPGSSTWLQAKGLGFLLGALTTLAVALLTDLGGPIRDAVLSVATKEWLLKSTLLLLCLLAFSWGWIRVVTKENNRLKRPLTERYKFVPEGGYYVDSKTSFAVCARCLADEKIIHMMETGGACLCQACGQTYPKNPDGKK